MKHTHLEILVEDLSGKVLIEGLLPRILPDISTRVIHYRGIGRIPPGLAPKTDASKRILLDQLPRLLAGYGKSLPRGQAVVVVADSDRRNCREFLAELQGVLGRCHPAPTTLFRLAIEEMEAWLLGDLPALQKAFSGVKVLVVKKYVQDSVCGTWEVLAEAIHPDGAAGLKAQGARATGTAKSEWAAAMARHMDVERNRSPSFRAFVRGLRRLAG